MVHSCSAINCTNRRTKGCGRTFHNFPVSRPKVFKLWLLYMRRDKWMPNRHSKLCSDHFEDQCFDRTGRIVRLKPEAVPTLFNFRTYLSRQRTKWIPTLPLNLYLKQSKHPSREYEVWSLEDISIGVKFGPYQGTFIDINKNDKKDFQWQVETIEKGKMILDRRNESESNWLPYVNYARHEEESNMITFHSESGVYYMSSRLIPANTELLVQGQYNITEEERGYNKKETGCYKIAQNGESLVDHVYNSKNKGTCNGVKDSLQFTASSKEVATKEISLLPHSISLMEKTKLISYKKELCVSSKGTCSHANVSEKQCEYNENQNYRTDAFRERKEPKTHKEISENIFKCKVDKKLDSNKINHKCLDRFEPEERGNNQLHLCFECNVCRKRFKSRKYLIRHEITHNSQKPFECNSCGKKFITKRHLTVHEMIHTGEKLFGCSVCGNKFKNKDSLKRHERTHSVEKPFECNTCGKKFSIRSYLIMHERIHSVEKRFECNTCGKKFNNRNQLTLHERTHTGEKPFECNSCGKKFNCRSKLTLHESTHTGKEPFECNTCGKKFTYKGHLTTHQIIHTNEKPFGCNACGKKFNHRCNLRRHERIHAGEKPFDCNTCGKKFTSRCYLIIHERIHTGEKPFACDICDKKFTSRNCLIVHERTHTNEKPFACYKCGKKFSFRSYLIVHERTHTSEKPFVCYKCGKRFTSNSYLIVHERIHSSDKPFKCNTCGKKFILRCYLTVHERIHTDEKPFICYRCGKGFTSRSYLIKHERTHSGEKPFECTTCGKKFAARNYLIMHERIHTGKLFECNMCRKKFNNRRKLTLHERMHTGEAYHQKNIHEMIPAVEKNVPPEDCMK